MIGPDLTPADLAANDQALAKNNQMLDKLVGMTVTVVARKGRMEAVMANVAQLVRNGDPERVAAVAATAIVRLAAAELERRQDAEDVRHERTADAASYWDQNPPSTQEPE